MHRKGSRLQIALELNPGGLNEALVLRIVRNGWQSIAPGCFPRPPQIRIKERVGSGQQPGRLRRRLFAELHRQSDGSPHNYDRQKNGESASNSHGMRSGLK
jgi:hypothetical protein